MNTTPSLAARVHQYASAGNFDIPLSPADQEALFGIELALSAANFSAAFADDGQMKVSWTEDNYPCSMTLGAIQSKIDTAEEYHDDMDGLTVDMYRTFPKDMVDIYTIRNDRLDREQSVFGSDADDAKALFARYHGYSGWAEMRALSIDGDMEEDWIVERKA